jgi:acetyltransferase-like isoleucine patch superfamily enzyme
MKLLAKVPTWIEGLKSRWRNLWFRLLGVRLNGYVWMRQIEIPRNYGQIEIDAGVSLDRGVVLLGSGDAKADGSPKIRIGARTYINRNTMLDATESIEIGSDCAIGPGCYITDHDHGFELDAPPLAQPMVSQPTRLGNRVWLGAMVVVLKGVQVADGAVIGAGSVVTKDVPSNAIAAGVPARVLRYRSHQNAPGVAAVSAR